MADQEISAPEPSGGIVEKLQKSPIANNVTQGMGLVYGLGMCMFSGWNQMLNSYWSYFLTNAVGMDPQTMGTITSAASLAAWVFVFIAAIVVERVWFRWGQFRSYLLIAPPLAFICIMGAWTDWTWLGIQPGSGLQIGLISGCYLLGQFFISLFMISGTSMITAVSKTEADRSLMSARKGQFNMAIKLLFSALGLPMIIFFSGGDVAAGTKPDTVIGYTITSAIWGILFVIAFVGLFFMFKGKDPTEAYCERRTKARKEGIKLPPEIGTNQKISVVEAVKFFFTNLPALGLFIGEVGRAVYTMVLQSVAVYYCAAVFGNALLYAGMMTAGNGVGLVGTIAGEALARKSSNRFTYLTGIVIVIVGLVAAFFFAAGSELIFTVTICITFFGANMMMAVEYACMSDASAYQEWKKGKTAKAFIMGTIQWCPNIGKICQGFIVGWGLAFIGYSADAAMTPELVNGLTFITFMIPALVMALCFVLFFFMHRLTRAQMEEVNHDLAIREDKESVIEAAEDAEAFDELSE